MKKQKDVIGLKTKKEKYYKQIMAYNISLTKVG